MRRYVVLCFGCLFSIITYSQNITNVFWGLTWKSDVLDAYYSLKAQGLAPKICPIGDETIISIENISYNNIRWEICSMLFSSHKLWDVQFIKNYFKQKDQNEDYDDIKVMLSKQYPHYPPVNLKWRAATTEAYCIEDKKTLLCCEQFYNNSLKTYALSLRYTYKKYLK